ncbi:MAG: TRAP transporter large permease subunit [Exilibacterium sp.]
MIGIILFILALLLLFAGYPIAFTFAGVSLIVSAATLGTDLFDFMPFRIMSIMENTIMMAIPMFVFMGIVMQKTGLAERLLESMGKLFGGMSGGLAVSTIVVGTFMAASTGVVGASVVAMGVISLPVMLKYQYHQPTATGVICAAGTLGQIVPPSIVLILLGDVLGVPVGDLFKAALLPSALLIGGYLGYILILSYRYPDSMPPIQTNEKRTTVALYALRDIVAPMLLIVAVLGSIFTGLATPTESAALGGFGSLLLAAMYGRFSLQTLKDSAMETVKVSSMVFSYSGADYAVEEFILSLPGEKWFFIGLAMLTIFVLGFFIDFIEIAFIVVPILAPIAETLGLNMVWFAILIAMNLQTSFLTPPFGFSLFYLKGVAPPSIKTSTIYRGAIPFIGLQMLVLLLIVLFPDVFILV